MASVMDNRLPITKPLLGLDEELHEKATDLDLVPQPWWDDEFAKWAIERKMMEDMNKEGGE